MSLRMYPRQHHLELFTEKIKNQKYFFKLKIKIRKPKQI